MNTLQPFRLDVPQADLTDLHTRLARVRWPNEAPSSPWLYGTPLAFMRELSITGATATTGAARARRRVLVVHRLAIGAFEDHLSSKVILN